MIRTALVCLGPGGAGAFEIRQSPRRNPAADEVADHCRGRVSQSDMCVAPAQASFQWCSAMILQARWPVWEREELRVDTFPARCDSAFGPCLAPRAAASQSSHRYPQAARPSRRGFRAHQERPAWPSASYAMMRSGAILQSVGRPCPLIRRYGSPPCFSLWDFRPARWCSLSIAGGSQAARRTRRCSFLLGRRLVLSLFWSVGSPCSRGFYRLLPQLVGSY